MKYTPAQILALHKSGAKNFSKKKLRHAASDLGTAGGLKGGPARAEALTYHQTFTIARHAANERWSKPCPDDCPYCYGEDA